MIVINFKEGYVRLPLEYTGYGHYIYMLTDITNGMRYIDSYTGYPNKEDIYEEITEKPIYEAILKKGLDTFRLEILSKHNDNLFLHSYKSIALERFLICGLYNEGYYQRGVTESTVICIETGNTYDNPEQASERTNIDASSIRKVLRGKRKSAGGYTWKYYKDYLR